MVKKPTPISLTPSFVLPLCSCDSLLSVSQTEISNVETDNCKSRIPLALPHYLLQAYQQRGNYISPDTEW